MPSVPASGDRLALPCLQVCIELFGIGYQFGDEYRAETLVFERGMLDPVCHVRKLAAEVDIVPPHEWERLEAAVPAEVWSIPVRGQAAVEALLEATVTEDAYRQDTQRGVAELRMGGVQLARSVFFCDDDMRTG